MARNPVTSNGNHTGKFLKVRLKFVMDEVRVWAIKYPARVPNNDAAREVLTGASIDKDGAGHPHQEEVPQRNHAVSNVNPTAPANSLRANSATRGGCALRTVTHRVGL